MTIILAATLCGFLGYKLGQNFGYRSGLLDGVELTFQDCYRYGFSQSINVEESKKIIEPYEAKYSLMDIDENLALYKSITSNSEFL